MSQFFIPAISDERIRELSELVFATVRRDGQLHFIHPVHPRNVAFTWSPDLAERAEGLEEIARIRTLHTYGYHGFFKPSIAEVYAQIPEYLLHEVVAFETNGPDTVHDLNRERDALNAGYHVAETILYRAV